jgi:hypothetical protein
MSGSGRAVLVGLGEVVVRDFAGAGSRRPVVRCGGAVHPPILAKLGTINSSTASALLSLSYCVSA